MHRYKTDISKTYDTIFFNTKCNWYHFEKISNYIGFVYCYQIDTNFLPIALIFDCWIKYCEFFSYQCSQDLEMWLFPFIYYWFWTIEKQDYECWISSKPILWMLNWFKTDITNVESVQNRYYECWIGSKPILPMLDMFKVLSIWNGYKMRNLRLVPILFKIWK